MSTINPVKSFKLVGSFAGAQRATAGADGGFGCKRAVSSISGSLFKKGLSRDAAGQLWQAEIIFLRARAAKRAAAVVAPQFMCGKRPTARG